MITIKTERELALMREAGRVVAITLKELEANVGRDQYCPTG